MSVLPGGFRRAVMVLGACAVTFPSAALAVGEAGPTAKIGTSVLGVAAEPSGNVVAVGTAGPAMLVQRVAAAGIAATPFGAGNGIARGVAIQADGKIVIGGTDGSGVVRRLNSDGSVDGSFGSGGAQALPGVTVNAVAVTPSGQIVVGGSSPGGDGFERLTLVRLNANGTPDGGFGNGGTAQIDLGRNSQAKNLAIQADGKIVFAGQQIPDLQVPNALIGRANSNGSLDTGFASNGAYFYFHPKGGANSTFSGVAIDASGRIVGAGADLRDTGSFALFVRLDANGAPDGSFGEGGVLTPDASTNYNGGSPIGANTVVIAGGGTIVGAGGFADSGQKSSALWAITPAGQLDPSVGPGGRVLTQQGSALAEGFAAAVTFDGSIFVGGTSSDDLFLPNSGFVTRHNGFGPTATPPPPPPPPPPAAVKFTAASLSPRTLRPSTKASLRFTLTRAAQVTLTVDRALKGRKKGKQTCKKPSRANRGGKSCTYYSRVKGSKRVSGKAGPNRVTFTRKFPSKNLKPGNYRLTLKAGSNVRRITFTVKSR